MSSTTHLICAVVICSVPLLAQSRNDFSYWDRNGNGDLTCSEVSRGLRLPAYEDDRNGTGVIYEWLERGRSSDSDGDGFTCESTSRPNGYVPVDNLELIAQGIEELNQPTPVAPTPTPVAPTPTPVSDPNMWRGLRVSEERARSGYNRQAFGTLYSRLEDDIIVALPPSMKANGKVHTPYSCIAFDIRANGTAATDIEHIVALAEAHDSGISNVNRRAIASDLDNLTIADSRVNRSQKSARDAADWMPARHGAWFAEQVILVKLKYDLSIDTAERDALELLLFRGGLYLNCVSPVE